MNEKINIFFLIYIFLLIVMVGICVFFGTFLHSDRNTIQQLERNNTELEKGFRGFKDGFNIISKESSERLEIIRNLQNSNTEFREDKERFRKDFNKIYSELRKANTELDRLREDAEIRSREAIGASERIRNNIGKLESIIESIEKKPDN